MVNEYKKIVLLKGLEVISDYHFNMVKSLLAKELKLTRKMQDEYNRIKIADLLEDKFQNDAGLNKLISVLKDIPMLEELAGELKKEKMKVKPKTPVKKKQEVDPVACTSITSDTMKSPESQKRKKESLEKTETKKNKISGSKTIKKPEDQTHPSCSTLGSVTASMDHFLPAQVPASTPFRAPPTEHQKKAQCHLASRRSVLHKGPMIVMVLKATDPFEYESAEEGTSSMFHATVATENQFFQVKVFNTNLKEKFTKNKVITISNYLECKGILEVNDVSVVSEAGLDQKIEVPNSVIKRANETPKIDHLHKQAPGTLVYGLFMLHTKKVNKKNTIYEIQDNTGKIDVMGSGKWHNIQCDEGNKLRLFCFQLRTINKKLTLVCGDHSFIKVIKSAKNKKRESNANLSLELEVQNFPINQFSVFNSDTIKGALVSRDPSAVQEAANDGTSISLQHNKKNKRMVNEYKKIVLLVGLETIEDYEFRLIKSLLAKDLKLTKKMQEDYDRIRIADLMEEKFHRDAGLGKLITLCKDIPALAELVETLKTQRLKVKRKSKVGRKPTGEKKSTGKKVEQDESPTAQSRSTTNTDSEPESEEEIPSSKHQKGKPTSVKKKERLKVSQENKMKKSENPERTQLPPEQGRFMEPSATNEEQTAVCPQTPQGPPPEPSNSPPIKRPKIKKSVPLVNKQGTISSSFQEGQEMEATNSKTNNVKVQESQGQRQLPQLSETVVKPPEYIIHTHQMPPTVSSSSVHTPQNPPTAPPSSVHAPQKPPTAPPSSVHTPQKPPTAPPSSVHAPQKPPTAPPSSVHTPQKPPTAPPSSVHTPQKPPTAPPSGVHATQKPPTAPLSGVHTSQMPPTVSPSSVHTPQKPPTAPTISVHIPQKPPTAPPSSVHTPQKPPTAPTISVHIPQKPPTAPPSSVHTLQKPPTAPCSSVHIPQKPPTAPPSSVHIPQKPPTAPPSSVHAPQNPPTAPPSSVHTLQKPPTAPSSSVHIPQKPPTAPPSSVHTPQKPPTAPPSSVHTPQKPPTAPPSNVHTPQKPPTAPPSSVHTFQKPPTLSPSSVHTSQKPPTVPPSSVHTPQKPPTAPPRSVHAPQKPLTAPSGRTNTFHLLLTLPSGVQTSPLSPPNPSGGIQTPQMPPAAPDGRIPTPHLPWTSPGEFQTPHMCPEDPSGGIQTPHFPPTSSRGIQGPHPSPASSSRIQTPQIHPTEPSTITQNPQVWPATPSASLQTPQKTVTSFSSGLPTNPRLKTVPKEASEECGHQKGPKEVVVLKVTEPFTYEFKEGGKKMFHATVATESEFFRVKVFDINLKDKFIPKTVIAISDYIGRNGFLEVYSASTVSHVSADRKMEISKTLIKNANATPKIEYLCSRSTTKYVNGVYTVYKKNVREDCTYYEIQDDTGKMEVVVYGRLTYINCEEGDKLNLFCFELTLNADKWQLRSVFHSYIKVIKGNKSKTCLLNRDSNMDTSQESS
ncbi:gamma-interferon-inducible protein 16-like [Urocitellus parryii]